jgi:hypothetical protein
VEAISEVCDSVNVMNGNVLKTKSNDIYPAALLVKAERK